jgi:hypothetical protein
MTKGDENKRRLELADIDRRMQEEENEQAEIAVQMNVNRNKYLDEVVQVNAINYIYIQCLSVF